METSLALSPGARRFALLQNSVLLLEHLSKAGRLLCAVVQESRAGRPQEEIERIPVNTVSVVKLGHVWEDLGTRIGGRKVRQLRIVEIGEELVVAENLETQAQTSILRSSFEGNRPRFRWVSNGS